jgi:hypothetical protein
MGYEKLTVPNIAVISGKETFLELGMTPSFEVLSEVTVKNGNGKGQRSAQRNGHH